MKNVFILILAALVIWGCGKKEEKQPELEQVLAENESKEVHGTLVQDSDLQITTPLNEEWVKSGQAIYDTKCQACHRLDDQKVVGPGWAGVTKKRKPAWIINMITNVDVMLAEDEEAQKLLELCLVRMPNQNVSQDEARQILEFMRKNDGEK